MVHSFRVCDVNILAACVSPVTTQVVVDAIGYSFSNTYKRLVALEAVGCLTSRKELRTVFWTATGKPLPEAPAPDTPVGRGGKHWTRTKHCPRNFDVPTRPEPKKREKQVAPLTLAVCHKCYSTTADVCAVECRMCGSKLPKNRFLPDAARMSVS